MSNPEKVMEANTQERKQYNDQFKHAAVQFFQSSGKGLEEVATELGLRPDDLRHWKRKYPHIPEEKAARPLTSLAKLQAENKALRDEILNLKVQWDVLKTTLGILSTTVCPRENLK
jgi:transposase-like protein